MTRIIISTAAICLLVSPLLLADDPAEGKKYEYGQDQASLLAVERRVEDSMDDKAQQSAMAAKLLEVMTDPGATLAAKQHAGIMLRICGTEAEVPALANMLGKGKAGEFARGSLERIPATAAGKALRDALGRLDGPALIGVINSTVNRHDREAVGGLVRLTASDDAAVAAAAAHALGRLGGAEAAACLNKLAQSGKDPQIAHAYLSCGIIAVDDGDMKAAGEIFAALADPKYPAPVRRSAFSGQLMLSRDPETLLTAWLDGDDPEACQIAVHNVQKQSTAWLLVSLQDKPAAGAVLFAEVLASRAEKAALPILVEAARQEDDQALRVRGITAIAKVADRNSVALLIDALDEETPVSRAAVTVLSLLPCELVDDALIEGLRKCEGQQRAKLIDVLIARRMTGAVPVLLELAKTENDAALREDMSSTLVILGDDTTLFKLVDIILAAKDGKHRDKMETTYLEIAKKHDNTVEPIVAAMGNHAATVTLLPVLGRVGGDPALKKIQEALASRNDEVRAAGVRALCNWPDASVADQLAALAKEDQDRGVRVSALRAYIRVVSLDSDRPDKRTLEMLQWAFGVAERPEEKNLIIDRVSTVRTMETLRWLVRLLDNETVAQEACRSIVDLAHHRYLRNPNRDEFVKALKRVIEVSKDASTVSGAKGYIEGV